MSLLDTVSKLFGGGSNQGALAGILQLLANHEGGTSGLTQSFQSNGLGAVLSSWLGQGENQPISPDQVNRVFGNDRIATVAGKLGVQPDQASAKIAQLLPNVVDHLSPDGKLPEGGDLMARASELLKGVLTRTG